MRVRQLIPVLLALLMPMTVIAQSGFPNVAPTATYTDEEGNLATADRDNSSIGGQAPLVVNFYANPIDNYSIDYNHQTSYDVTVTADGASISDIQFYYVRRVNPVSISVVCVDEKGNIVSSYSQTCGEGTTAITAQPVDGYDINYNYPTQYDIIVTADGASMI